MRTTRQSIFEAGGIAKQLPLIIERQGQEIERLQAARDAESLGYQIRNYFPHPIALRHEKILQSDRGKRKIDEILDCAEHFMTLLALIALLQESSDEIVSGPVQTMLRTFVRASEIHPDWGKCFSMLEDGVNFVGSYENPLRLNF